METIGKGLNGLWQGYLLAVEWVAQNPQKTIWLAGAAVIAALVL